MNIIDNLSNEWSTSGLNTGDIVLIHSRLSSSIRKLKKDGFKVTVGDFYNSFLNVVGSEGTLIFPFFNFNFVDNKFFDINSTPSNMGALSEYARLQKNIVRTGHPIYSFGAVGSKSSLFQNINNISGYGEDSPFALLTKLDAKIGVLGLPDQNSMTFYHHVEEICGVHYRHYKKFTGNYIDSKKKQSIKTYKLYVRDIEQNVLTDVESMGDLLWKKKLYKGNRYNKGNFFRTIKATDIYRETNVIIASGLASSYLYKINK